MYYYVLILSNQNIYWKFIEKGKTFLGTGHKFKPNTVWSSYSLVKNFDSSPKTPRFSIAMPQIVR